MTDPITARLDRVKALADAATDGPWGHYSPRGRGKDPIFGAIPGDEVALVKRPDDWKFIAAARTDLVWMEAAIRAVMEYVNDTEVYGQDGQGMTDYESGYMQALAETQDDVRSILETKLRAVQDAAGGQG